jgi:DNA-binding NtrC family response regulator
VGKIEQAHGGTVFLDEIGDMPSGIQAKILRLLQEKSIERLGGREPIPVDVRIIAATNRNLESALESGRFREDLYYRLRVVTLWIPALRDRADDIPRLAEYFLSRYSNEVGMDNPGISTSAMEHLMQYSWPGNVRELGNAIHKALIFNRGAPVSPEDLSQVIEGKDPSAGAAGEEADEPLCLWVRSALAAQNSEHVFDDCVDRFARVLVSEALNLTGGNRSRTAKLLGLSRPTLHAKIEKYGLKLETSVRKE